MLKRIIRQYLIVKKDLILVVNLKSRSHSQYLVNKQIVAEIKRGNPRFLTPEKLLNGSDDSVRECLAKILGTDKTSVSKLMERLAYLSQDLIRRSFGSRPTYDEIVITACRKLSLSRPASSYQGEKDIAIHCFKEMYQKLSPIQREEYEAALKKQSETLQHLNPSFTPSMLSAGAIIAARTSGFGVYLAASTLVGAITHTIGIRLPFIFYTTMSSTIAAFLGPIGWLAVGSMVVNTIFGADFSKVTQGIILIASLRAESELKWEKSLIEAREQLRITAKELQNYWFVFWTLIITLLMYWLTIPIFLLLTVIILHL
jgi:uncharacterized protein YaaW (UPF0174 family)